MDDNKAEIAQIENAETIVREPSQRLPTSGRMGRSRFWTFLPRVLLVLILIVYFLFLLSRFAPAIATPDANGYWAQGSLLFTTGRTWFVPESDTQYIGMHWLVTESGRYFSRYPPGLAVLVGLVYTLAGLKASVLVNPVLATLSLIGLYFLIRRLLAPWWCVAGVLVLAMNPIFNQHAIACDSHVAVTFCLVWGLIFLLRWSEQGRLWEIFLAGVLLGCIPTIRYPEALFALGIGVFLLWHVRSRERIWLHYLVAILGACLPLVPLLIRNQLAFGAFYRTAYALTKEQTGFGWDYFKSHFVDYVRNLQGDGVGLFFPLGVIGMTAMCCVRRYRRVGVLLAVLTIPSTLLYMSYYWGPQRMAGATLRFLIPTFICYIVAGLWALSQAMKQAAMPLKASVVAVVLLLQFVWGGFNSLEETERLHYQKSVLACITDALEKQTHHGDVIIGNRRFLEHLDFVRHWRLVDPMILNPRPANDRFMGDRRRQRDPDAPTPMQSEKRDIQTEKYRNLDPEEQVLAVARDIRTWAGDGKVYYVGSESELDRMRGPCLEGKDFFKIVARVSLPEAPPMPEREGMMGGGMRPGPPGDGAPPPGDGPQPPGLGGPGADRFRPPLPGQRPGGPGMDRFRPPFPGPDGAMNRGRPGDDRFGGRFGRRRDGRSRPGGGMGGPMGGFMGGMEGEKEVVIAEWSWRPPGDPKKE